MATAMDYGSHVLLDLDFNIHSKQSAIRFCPQLGQSLLGVSFYAEVPVNRLLALLQQRDQGLSEEQVTADGGKIDSAGNLWSDAMANVDLGLAGANAQNPGQQQLYGGGGMQEFSFMSNNPLLIPSDVHAAGQSDQGAIWRHQPMMADFHSNHSMGSDSMLSMGTAASPPSRSLPKQSVSTGQVVPPAPQMAGPPAPPSASASTVLPGSEMASSPGLLQSAGPRRHDAGVPPPPGMIPGKRPPPGGAGMRGPGNFGQRGPYSAGVVPPPAKMVELQDQPPNSMPSSSVAVVPPRGTGTDGVTWNSLNGPGDVDSNQYASQEQHPQQAQVVLEEARGALEVQLFDAVKKNSVQDAKAALDAGADPNWREPTPEGWSCLHRALMSGGRRDIVAMLLMAKADVNAADSEGRTALHLSMERYLYLSPVIFRMLLDHQADIQGCDLKSRTPLDYAKDIAGNMQLHQRANSVSSRAKIRQLLHELTKHPTRAIHVADGDVGNALFGDQEAKRIVYNTRTQIGVFDLEQKSVIAGKRLQNSVKKTFIIQSIAVNPLIGVIAACIECTTRSADMQHMVFVWAQGMTNYFNEEPLGLSIKANLGERHFGTMTISISKNSDPEKPTTLVARLRDGQVFCWILDPQCTRVSAEWKLAGDGLRAAMSDDGLWIAVATEVKQSPSGGALEVYSLEPERIGNRDSPAKLCHLEEKQSSVAIARVSGDKGYLATSSHTPNSPAAVIQVWSLPEPIIMREMAIDCHCRALVFCYNQPHLLLSSHDDGQVVLTDLERKQRATSCDELYVRSIDVSSDTKLVVSTCNDYLRVYNSPQFKT
eukprot:gnl/MRDRNA2_/MRDRNA2_181167_c0_seq1.p1 gnl/MRDRNA2_/MRDRNA2_181167_c0~~gnl/MRDRNA2_/MRDRNA2_181167_c0_seq1.p1  ORF type:complete len:822 (+),score=164.27 gnl/MRDRNA2_/MRDRNA2_181167_c0_seq1:173-2638(+)